MILSHEVTVIEKSRRVGLSWGVSWLAALVASSSREAGGMDVFYMGFEKDMTRQFVSDAADHAKLLEIPASEVGESLFIDPENPDRDLKIFRLDFGSGYEVLGLPSVARAFRSKQGLVIIDEAAFIDDLQAVLDAAFALLIWGGRIVIISSHNGDQSPFNTLVNDIRAGRHPDYALMRITFDDALAQGLYRTICLRQGQDWSAEGEAGWRDKIIRMYGDGAEQELFCIPQPSTGAYIPLAVIEARSVPSAHVIRWSCDPAFTLLPEKIREAEARRFCEEQLLPVVEQLDQKTPHCFGEDFGRTGDLTVLWFLAIERSLLRHTPFVLELRNVPFEQQKQILFWIVDRLPRFRAGKMDSRGNGQYLAEVAVQRYGERIEAVMLSEGWYRDNMPPFKAAMEDGTITIPADRDIHDDIRSLKIVRGIARVPDSRSADQTGTRHGDAAIAVAMAWAASRADPEEYGYQAAPNPYGMNSGSGGRHEWAVEDEIARERSGRRDFYGLRGSVRL
ncbi:hypothetical protein GOB85_12565 [Acetobacter sp. LMG 1636]|uniref:Mu-like prophage FluMu protein gp28 n=1 Tax=Acetobacter fallax TaxID=1737473 RepID=A0ABX0KAY1_9PROT|nr:hypothetical protein [Acetobacter fallax]NHO36937.1 hypothetical protein [Acetobacter fallax]